MRTATLLVAAAIAAGAAACNTPTEGANGNLQFTPQLCGGFMSCDFNDSIGVYGQINVTIDGLNGTSTAGLDLASDDTSVLTVEPGEDIGGQPSWVLTATGAGVARLAALTPGAEEVDFVEVGVQDVQYLTLESFVGDAVGPSDEAGYDEGWTVNADQLVSWYVRPRIAGDAPTMGRFSIETVLDAGNDWLTGTEESSSDRPNGYLYVRLPVGDYPIRFEVTEDPGIGVDAMIHAVQTQQ
ncbi:MAG: hypothetical protein H6709_04485 [Kofleriaceae bacterium]|nr:hypothetical protein [Myxococcales bacterium]MCB9561128.1 hypothetical protein [Kofleriaceae bacterium]MCB9571326.1 hypothetical protein [Kofleriaceae bacterium]